MLHSTQMSMQIKIYSLGALVGVVSGITAVLFRYLIIAISSLFVMIPAILGAVGWVVIPVVGGLLVAFIVVKFAPEAKGHGVPEVMEAYVLQNGKMRVRVPLLKSLA